MYSAHHLLEDAFARKTSPQGFPIMTPDVYIRPAACGISYKRGAARARLRSDRDTARENTDGNAKLRLRLDAAVYAQAVDLALRYGVEIQFDEQAQTPYFYYTDNGTQHVVWFDDPRSIDAKLQLIDDYRLAGASWWTVNRCYVPNWLVLQNMYETVKL